MNAEFQEQAEKPEEVAVEEKAEEKNSAEDVKRLERELAELKDKQLRLYAEFDNFRRRTAKENFELVVSANHKLIGKLTEVLDNFELAFNPKHKTGNPEDLEKGFRLIYGKFREILEEEGLEEVNPVGMEFDPNHHDALMQQSSETVPENHVVEVLQKGYKAKSKILKHAKVIVSQGKESG